MEEIIINHPEIGEITIEEVETALEEALKIHPNYAFTVSLYKALITKIKEQQILIEKLASFIEARDERGAYE